ncbi:MAG: hypothetical protein K0R47_5624, partial [Brevibacillus sp.]|nr:hypothetical protein [Brevibacillus sp.]
ARLEPGNSGGLAQLGEHLPYKQRVGGSIPSASTTRNYPYGGRGEGVNAPDCGSGTRGFKSHRSPHKRIPDVSARLSVRNGTLFYIHKNSPARMPDQASWLGYFICPSRLFLQHLLDQFTIALLENLVV